MLETLDYTIRIGNSLAVDDVIFNNILNQQSSKDTKTLITFNFYI